MRNTYAWTRLQAIIIKEFSQLKRDYTTFAMIIGIPLVQIILFGFAINNDPKHLPTVVLDADKGFFARTVISGLENTQYFKVIQYVLEEAAAEDMLAMGKAKFVVNIPVDFSQKLLHGDKPSLLLEADGTDPTGIANAVAAANTLSRFIFDPAFVGGLSNFAGSATTFNLLTHVKYNPTGITQYNIVPGLLGLVLTMTLVLVTAMAITRERERGTMENLLITPVRPIEVIVGKSLPYIVVGYLQALLILAAAYLVFAVPVKGSLLLLLLASLPFILANLLVGIAFSTMADTQLQASQVAIFFYLPSILLSGFVFPFQGMPLWAQWLGNMLPLTHYINICRGVLLKGNGWLQIWPELWPIFLFMLVSMVIAVKRYRQTLD